MANGSPDTVVYRHNGMSHRQVFKIYEDYYYADYKRAELHLPNEYTIVVSTAKTETGWMFKAYYHKARELVERGRYYKSQRIKPVVE